jgi:hypothetical protein
VSTQAKKPSAAPGLAGCTLGGAGEGADGLRKATVGRDGIGAAALDFVVGAGMHVGRHAHQDELQADHDVARETHPRTRRETRLVPYTPCWSTKGALNRPGLPHYFF